METVIKEYSEAVRDSLKASQDALGAENRKRLAHYRLIRAKDELRARERELLEDSERDISKK